METNHKWHDLKLIQNECWSESKSSGGKKPDVVVTSSQVRSVVVEPLLKNKWRIFTVSQAGAIIRQTSQVPQAQNSEEQSPNL